MRFLHTSDWHLGRIFHGVHLTEDQAYVLAQFIELIKETKPDCVIIAGDVYDRAVPPPEAVQLLDEVLSKILLDYKTPVLMIAGNHDSAERLGFGSRLLAGQGLHVAGLVMAPLQPVILEDEHGPVYFVLLPFAEPLLVRENLNEPAVVDHHTAMQAMLDQALTQVPPGVRKVAVAHIFAAGGQVTESERPLSVGGTSQVRPEIFAPFAYTALGHLHQSQQAGSPAVRYSGSLLKYSFAEAEQTKGINVVDIDALGGVTVERISLQPKRDVRCINGLFAEVSKGPSGSENAEDYVLVTLEDAAPILDAHARLREVYPNMLAMQYARIEKFSQNTRTTAEQRRLGEKELFAAFFEQATGLPLTAEESAGFDETLNEVYRQAREV